MYTTTLFLTLSALVAAQNVQAVPNKPLADTSIQLLNRLMQFLSLEHLLMENIRIKLPIWEVGRMMLLLMILPLVFSLASFIHLEIQVEVETSGADIRLLLSYGQLLS